jgi:hypothetical protein
MKTKYLLSAGALAAALLSPGMASAGFILDTGTPTGSGSDTFNSTTWYAEEFYAYAGESITTLSAYLTLPSGGSLATPTGTPFTFGIYENSGPGGAFTDNTAANIAANEVYTTAGNFSVNGWNSTTAGWTASTSGYYWLAVQQTSPGTTYQLDAPTEASTSTGTAPDLGFAIYASKAGAEYIPSTTKDPIGLEVTAVPLPAGIWLLGSALAGLGGWCRRRSGVAAE